MRAGRFEQIAPADEIYARPVSRFVAEFMGEVNLFPVRATGGGLASAGLSVSTEAAARIDLDGADRGTLVVRPENVKFLGSAPASYDITVNGRVLNEFNLGSRIQYEVESTEGVRMTVETLREDRFAGPAGAPVRLGWNLDHCHMIAGE